MKIRQWPLSCLYFHKVSSPVVHAGVEGLVGGGGRGDVGLLHVERGGVRGHGGVAQVGAHVGRGGRGWVAGREPAALGVNVGGGFCSFGSARGEEVP